jgi:hypothetical protein
MSETGHSPKYLDGLISRHFASWEREHSDELTKTPQWIGSDIFQLALAACHFNEVL